jgi:hypothetical protein
MRHSNANARGGRWRIRYWPILLIMAAIAETVHAPSIGRSSASSAVPAVNVPTVPASKSPAAKDVGKSGTVPANPSFTLDDPASDADLKNVEIQPFNSPTQQDAPALPNLLPDVPDQSPMLGLDTAALPSAGAVDPLIQPPVSSNPVENGFSGLLSNGIIDNGPVSPGRVKEQSTLTTTTASSVPEPGLVMILAIGAVGLLRRRSR